MSFTRLACFLVGFASCVHAQTKSRPVDSRLLDLPLAPVRVVQDKVPFSNAFEQIGIRVRNSFVLFGVETHLRGGKELAVSLDLPPGSTVGSALQQVLRQVPDYTYEIAGRHLINVYPLGAKTDAQNVLNTVVRRFDVAGEQASSILSAPEFFIPELKRRLAPPTEGAPGPSGYAGRGLRGTAPPVTLHLTSVTVRQILNAIAEATEQFPPQYAPLGWVYSFQPDPALPSGGKHTWAFLFCAPHNWKEEAEKQSTPPPQ